MADTSAALITGASRGLGLALARALADRGWVLIIDARDAGALRAAAQELSARTRVVAIPGDVSDPAHRQQLALAAAEIGGLDLVVNSASTLGVAPLPELLKYPLGALEDVFRTNVVAPLGVLQAVQAHLFTGAAIVNISSDAAVESYEGWGGYGASKAALEQVSNVLAAERPDLRVYWVDPGDMRTQMQQDAFPGEDISDRPLPEESVPGLLALIDGSLPSGRYSARAVPVLP
jgi:NAD(P)-dependent dehydrogenase (short-subunit alcohol dehydrogenase family)